MALTIVLELTGVSFVMTVPSPLVQVGYMLIGWQAGISGLDGYLATSPGGIYAVLATAVETGSNVTFIVAAQVIRGLLMLFAAPLLARGFLRMDRRHGGQISASTSASREPIRVAD